MRREIVSVALSFAGTSLYWLVSALRMDATGYGQMMQVQAVLMTITALFTLRTHDLVFHLTNSYGWTLRRAFASALKLEFALVGLGAVSALLAWHWIARYASDAHPGASSPTWPVVVLLANLSILQGASAAYLRSLRQDTRIATADLVTALAWAAALGWLLAAGNPHMVDVLLMGFGAAAVRPVSLSVLAVTTLAKGPTTPGSPANAAKPRHMDVRSVSYILLAGQFTNMLKNNLLSLETLLLGRLVPAESVAVFRIARSFLNFSNVLLNISYQKTFRELANATPGTNRGSIIRAMNRSSLRIWGLSLPVIFGAAAVYLWVQPSGAYGGLMSAMVVATLASVPVVLQQSSFAALSLDNRFAPINFAYGAAFLSLLLACALMASHMNLVLFLIVSGLAALLRYTLLNHAARSETFA